MERRTYLATVGSTVTALSIGLAGCAEEEGPGAENETGNDTDGLGDGETPEGNETGMNETMGNETAGNETMGNETMGNETAGNETAGNETMGNETAGNETAGNETAGDGATTESNVDMVTEDSEFYFDPIGLFVESGTTVTWTNASGSHSSTAYHQDLEAAETTRIPEGAEPWNSETLSEEGATFEHTFEQAGTYDYFCIPHKQLGMVGRIVVDEPGGPATEGSPPDGELPPSQDIVDQGSISYDEFNSG